MEQNNQVYKHITVTRLGNAPLYTVEEFSNNLSMIGEHVASVHVNDGNDDTLKTVADACTNLRSVELDYCSIGALPFRNLHELKVGYGLFLSTDEWKNCFANNPGIVCLQYWDDGRDKCLPLLQMLPELKSLTVYDLELKPEDFHHLSCLTSLTTLCFWSYRIYNQLLIELALKLNLVELKVAMPYNADTFTTLKSFRCLEVLSIINTGNLLQIPETVIVPSTIKKIQLDIGISCSVLLSIVKQLKLLEEYDIGYNGKIFWDDVNTEYFPTRRDSSEDYQGSWIIYRIDHELRPENRKIKIIFYSHYCKAQKVFMYSANIEIIQRPASVKSVYDHTFTLQ